MLPTQNVIPFAVSQVSAAFGTVLKALVPPFPGPAGGPALAYAYSSRQGPNWSGDAGMFTRLASLLYTTAGTAHVLTVLRPLNFTAFAAAVAKNATAITLTADPGVYSTNYKYPTPGGAPPIRAADNAIAANDFVAFQYADGSWQLDTIASGTFGGANLVLTTGTINRTGATIAAGSPLFWFGITTDVDPATGIAHWNTPSIASTSGNYLGGTLDSGIGSLHKGDPMFVHSNNATATGNIDRIMGAYAKL